MKNNIKYILIILFFIIIAIAICLVVYFNLNKKEYVANEVQQNVAVEETTDENVLVVPVEGTGEKDPEPEPEKDAAAWTNEIYNLNMEIGTLTIPKTNLTTPIFCKQSKMEEMPCFLYTTGGLNRKGVTLITGHNKRNGKLFSNNKKLEEGDEFTFKDYEGKELKYTIYSKYITKDTDTSFLSIETDKPVMVLSCCTDANNDDRIIVMGRAE